MAMTSALQNALKLHRARRLGEAATLYREILEREPDNSDCLRLIAAVHNELGNHTAALRYVESAIKISSNDAQAFNTRGNILRKMDRREEALASYDKARGLFPRYAKAFSNRGTLLHELKRFDEALESFNTAIALAPNDAVTFNDRGNLFKEMMLLDDAVKDYDAAIALKPNYPDAMKNRGTALQEASRLGDALESYGRALAIRPDFPEALNNRGSVLFELGRFEEALAAYDEAIALNPDFASARLNRGMAYLSAGRFQEGWTDFEWRWRANRTSPELPGIRAPLWQGEDLDSRRIAVWAEQGLGDTIQFCRYLPLLAKRGAKVTFLAPAKLVCLLRSLSSDVTITAEIVSGEHFDFQTPLMSLPLRFGTELASIPADIPYLHAAEARIARWRSRLGRGKFKIGIAWQGNTRRRLDRERSVPLTAFLPLTALPTVQAFSLQKCSGVEQINHLSANAHIETLGEDFDSGPDAFLDSAGVIANLDLIVSSDTSIAHLAGALGRPTWVALKHVPDWRWVGGGATCPWYPTMMLFRQQRPGDWTDVFASIVAQLRARYF